MINKLIIILIIITIIWMEKAEGKGEWKGEKVNFIIILVDDLGYGDVNFLSPFIQSFNLSSPPPVRFFLFVYIIFIYLFIINYFVFINNFNNFIILNFFNITFKIKLELNNE